MKSHKSFQTPSAKPCDVEYRLKRFQQTLGEAMMFLRSIDASVYPDDYDTVFTDLTKAAEVGLAWTPPAKKTRKTEAEKAAAAEAKEQVRLQKAALKAAEKAAKLAEKVKSKSKSKVAA